MESTLKDDIIWLERTIEAYQNALDVAISRGNKEKEIEYKTEINKAKEEMELIK